MAATSGWDPQSRQSDVAALQLRRGDSRLRIVASSELEHSRRVGYIQDIGAAQGGSSGLELSTTSGHT